MAELVVINEAIGRFPSGLVTAVVVVALCVAIAANTALLAHNNDRYKWWYGLIKAAFYFGSFVLALSTGGVSAAIASVSTFLGMELNRLTQLMHQLGLLPRIIHALRSGKENTEGKNTAQR